MNKKWKKRVGVVYSTNQDFGYQEGNSTKVTSSANTNFSGLHVFFTKKGRGGKTVTLVQGVSNMVAAGLLAKQLKQHCGVGGTVKEGDIIIQGNQVDKIKAFLAKESPKIV